MGIGVGVSVGILASLALLAGLVYLIRRRSKIGHSRDEISAYLDNKQELDATEQVVHQKVEVEREIKALKLSNQSLVGLQHPLERPAVELY